MGNKTKQSQIAYDKKAKDYDATFDGRFTQPYKKELIKRVSVKDGDVLLDVACGNGYLLHCLSRKAKTQAFGIDISEKMIEVAKESYPACSFTVQACPPIPYEDESIDIITVSCAFHHFENPQGFVNECFRVLRSGGKVYIADPYLPPVIRQIANTVINPLLKAGDVRVYNKKEFQAFFSAAGFGVGSVLTKSIALFYIAEK